MVQQSTIDFDPPNPTQPMKEESLGKYKKAGIQLRIERKNFR
jgi:hypothetical protein